MTSNKDSQTSTESTKESSEKLLVQALVAGNVEKFEELIAAGVSLTALHNNTINNYLGAKDINIGTTGKNPDGSRKIINNIYNKKYSEDIKDIPLPALAAYYGDVELTQNLINEPREGVTNPWNFNQTLGKRPETPLAYAMTSSTEEGQKKIAHLLLDSKEKLKIDPSEARTGIIGNYSTLENLEEVAEYLNKIPELNSRDLNDVSNSLLGAMLQFNATPKTKAEEQQFEKVTNNILERVTKSPDRYQIISKIVDGMNEDTPISKRSIQMIQKAAAEIIYKEPTNTYEVHPLLEKLAKLGGQKTQELSRTPLSQPQAPSQMGPLKSIIQAFKKYFSPQKSSNSHIKTPQSQKSQRSK